ncbi:MAG: DUF1735 domain-containing protein [Dysgonamonadaceae bacterium]|nr:DUF1735 domain-containing protein [Dysgonamonadaceae bacterium]
MNRILYKPLLLLILTLTGLSACVDNRDNFLVDSRIYLVNPGISQMDVFVGMNINPARLHVIKSGILPQSANVQLIVNNAILSQYNETNGTSVQLLPSNFYNIVPPSIFFGNDDYREAFEVQWNNTLMGSLEPGSYGLPLQISANPQSFVAADRAEALFILNVRDATLEMSNSGFYPIPLYPVFGDLSDTQVQLNVRTTFLNNANITYRLEVDPQLLEAYNEANGTNFLMLPAAAFTLQTEGTLTATQNEAPFTLTYHGVGLNPGNIPMEGQYVVPIRIVSVSSEGGTVIPSPETATMLFPVFYELIELTRVTQWEVIGYNNSVADDPGLGAGWLPTRGPQLIIDNNPATFWMSVWTVPGVIPMYFTFDMMQEFTVYDIGLTHTTDPGQNWRPSPRAGYVEVSTDNANWTRLVNWTMVNGQSFRVSAPAPIRGRYIRLWITECFSGTQAIIGDFNVWGQ